MLLPTRPFTVHSPRLQQLGSAVYQQAAREEKGTSLSWDLQGAWLFPSYNYALLPAPLLLYFIICFRSCTHTESFLKEFLYHHPTSASHRGGKSYQSLQCKSQITLNTCLGRERGKGILMRQIKGSDIGEQWCRS